jgi:hypothetical protein
MSPDDTNRLIDEYEQDVDEIIAACRGDLRGAVKALVLISEQLGRTLRELSAAMIERQTSIGLRTYYTDHLKLAIQSELRGSPFIVRHQTADHSR